MGAAKRKPAVDTTSRDYTAGFFAGRAAEREDKKHEGWSNFYTWAVALYLDNDRPSYEYWREKVKEARAFAVQSADPEMASVMLSNALHDELYASMPDIGSGTHSFWADILNCARSEIDFGEIAEHLLAE